MSDRPRQITVGEWDRRYHTLKARGLTEPAYGGALGRHVANGDLRLRRLRLDNSPAALRLWNFLLSEEQRLFQARDDGHTIVATMKDLGTIPVMAYALPETTAFYPDGAWWIPCIMERSAGLLAAADSMGIDESFCPVRAMLGAFDSEAHFPAPDLITCSVGATCDDFSAIAQRLEGLGHDILWWEIPSRRKPDAHEAAVQLPGGAVAPQSQVDFTRGELGRVGEALTEATGHALTTERLAEGIRNANHIRRLLEQLRHAAYAAAVAPMGSLEMLIAEMLAIHFCSDRAETAAVLTDLLAEVQRRVAAGVGVADADAVRTFWVNPVADLRVMNLLEEAGGRLCGADLMFGHALDPIRQDIPPLDALAQTALADPMVGPTIDRAERICSDVRAFGAEAVVISRIPGASHCATEGVVIAEEVRKRMDIPVVEIEAPPIIDAMEPTLRTRLEALVETSKEQRRS